MARIRNLANKITLARIILVPVFIILLLSDLPRYASLAVFILLALSDMIDGPIARKRNEVTSLGKVLDPLADKLLVGAALIFLIGKGVEAWMAYVILARELIISALRSIVSTKEKAMGAKLSGKVKTVLQILAICIVLLELPYAYWAMLIATVFTIYSGIEYIWIERHAIKDSF